MTRIPLSEHLTPGDSKFERHAPKTFAGQAYLAGTGPKHMTCRLCIHWAPDGYLVSTSELKQSICKKYMAMMNGRVGSRFPHNAAACKYFEVNPTPPPAFNPKG